MKALTDLRLFLISGLFALSTTSCVFSFGDGTDKDSNNNNSVGKANACGLHSSLNAANQCVCETGYSWCDPAIDSGPNGRHNCCADTQLKPCPQGKNNHVNAQGVCHCLSGFEWCDKSNRNDFNCCEVKGGSSSGDNGQAVHPGPNETCDPNKALVWCSHDTKMGPAGSTYYVCENNRWVDRTNTLDEECKRENSDFAYGCMYDASNPQKPETRVVCGSGPGTTCTNTTADACNEDKSALHYCKYGRLTKEQCKPTAGMPCKTPDGKEFEFGICGEQDGKLSCLCSDNDPNSSSSSMGMGSSSTAGMSSSMSSSG